MGSSVPGDQHFDFSNRRIVAALERIVELLEEQNKHEVRIAVSGTADENDGRRAA